MDPRVKPEDDKGEFKPEDDKGEFKPEDDKGEFMPEDDKFTTVIPNLSLSFPGLTGEPIF
jgi:hypothetical protein